MAPRARGRARRRERLIFSDQVLASATHTYRPAPLEWVESFLRPEPWMESAACRDDGNPDTYFPEGGELPLGAFRACARCPVQQMCLEYAIDHEEQHGVWGGTTPRQRSRGVTAAVAASRKNAERAKDEPTVEQLAADRERRAADRARRARLRELRAAGLTVVEGANLERQRSATAATCQVVEAVLAAEGDALPERLAYVGQLRLQHPDLSIAELGLRAHPPMTKDMIAGILRRLVSRAAAYRA